MKITLSESQKIWIGQINSKGRIPIRLGGVPLRTAQSLRRKGLIGIVWDRFSCRSKAMQQFAVPIKTVLDQNSRTRWTVYQGDVPIGYICEAIDGSEARIRHGGFKAARMGEAWKGGKTFKLFRDAVLYISRDESEK